ncbi:MAG TPA: malto-oligosyltrehalose synthase [Steroidobacter sp.]|nr:malto-oligosyltrehalose synthase [Steroidobacter sp.]
MIPRATYRLQLNRDFTFSDAARIAPYLARLGVSHVYASPILTARPGSMHGYDVTDHTQLNPELGARDDFERLAATLRAHGMGLIVDIVPNHLGVMGCENQWWLDVLENGPAARSTRRFDIDWRPNRASLRDRILVPVLGASYGDVLERGELKLGFDRETGAFAVHYQSHCMPIDPREYPRIFANSPILESLLRADDANRADFESLMSAFGNLPPRNDVSEEAVAVRYRDKEAHKRRLVRLIERCPPILQYLESTLARLNGEPGRANSFDALDALLEAQAYRLAYWRVAVDEINYRRFFDVNDLAALRMDDDEVFESTHRLIFELVEQGAIDGLRIDHSDGLYDPEEYFDRLQQRFRAGAGDPRPLYVITEKILAAHERLPESWAVYGTTGYDFAALSTTWLVCGSEEVRTTRRYRQFTENYASFEQIAYQSRKLVMRASLAAEVEVLATQLDRVAQMDRRTSDFTRSAMRDAIIEVIASFPVYRTYISPRGAREEDRRVIQWAVGLARKRSASAELSVFDFLRDVLLGDAALARPASHRGAMLEFAMKFQQVTAPVAAKGVEDTAFYRYARLVCLNEVGGDPGRFAASAAAMHQASQERAKTWPHSLLTTSTHDAKRSEDVRARIAVLSELPDEWKLHLSRWARLNRSKRRIVDDRAAPSREDEYLLYQTLLGVWTEPQDETFAKRLQAYMTKAAREAKQSTSWINPNEEYEQALADFVARLLENPGRNAFVKDFSGFARRVAFFGRLNSLAVTVLKIASPGVPDFYQGSERALLSLVDPDNRGAVDFEGAALQLAQLQAPGVSPRGLLEDERLSEAKLFVTAKLLNWRKEHAALFAQGSYQALQIDGDRKEHVFAFARSHEQERCLVIVPRWTAKLMGGATELPLGERWGDTRIDVGGASVARELLSDKEITVQRAPNACWVRAADVFAEFPAALLVTSEAGDQAG